MNTLSDVCFSCCVFDYFLYGSDMQLLVVSSCKHIDAVAFLYEMETNLLFQLFRDDKDAIFIPFALAHPSDVFFKAEIFFFEVGYLGDAHA